VGVWLPGEKVKTHVHLLKSNFVMFDYLSLLCCCCAFDHPEAIFKEAAIPNFYESIFNFKICFFPIFLF